MIDYSTLLVGRFNQQEFLSINASRKLYPLPRKIDSSFMKRNMSRTTQLRQRLTKKPTRNLVTHNDLIRISTFIFGNIDPLAEACSISFDDLCEIKKDCTRNDTNALRILEKWVQDNPRCTKEDLHKLLLLTKQKHAAKSLFQPRYKI